MTDQVEGARVKSVPGQPDMWMFVLFESLLFTAYFSVYLVSRTQNPELFLQSQSHLDLRIGVVNTIALLLSSWAIARCVQASREGNYRSALTNVILTISFGVIFLVGKIIEWVTQIRMGNTFTSDEFFQHYFFLTLDPLHPRLDRLRRCWVSSSTSCGVHSGDPNSSSKPVPPTGTPSISYGS